MPCNPGISRYKSDNPILIIHDNSSAIGICSPYREPRRVIFPKSWCIDCLIITSNSLLRCPGAETTSGVLRFCLGLGLDGACLGTTASDFHLEWGFGHHRGGMRPPLPANVTPAGFVQCANSGHSHYIDGETNRVSVSIACFGGSQSTLVFIIVAAPTPEEARVMRDALSRNF